MNRASHKARALTLAALVSPDPLRAALAEGEKLRAGARYRGWSEGRRLARQIEVAFKVAAEASDWRCGARAQGTAGGNDPADCGWPTCGCDPYANNVMEALNEMDFMRKPEEIRDAAQHVVLAAWTDRFSRLHGHPSVTRLKEALDATGEAPGTINPRSEPHAEPR